jgi:hypothetical protein
MAAMAVRKTFTLDDQSATALKRAAELVSKSESEIVCEAIREYHSSMQPLSERERKQMLAAIDRMMKRPPVRTQAEVDAEIEEIRNERRSGGRLHPVDR